ncbi:hypothetical protein LG197_17435 [Pseudomonas asiatica]|uniref:hypothetical protein n=1 Tax=Pseudomonas TaxID=286 RepID=UPI001E476C12|nr:MULTISPECIES: hypothetical protein [Pseudomonas]UFH29328.1 hypothetical protein LMH93_12245 [Pseudomonas sp. CIP-10]WDM86400.1 hypothetical protein LG197_17435 [Pseudomonas asiatica]WPX88276.1 hypothetical protein PsasTeo6_20008 [Pseudomonas asiatica]
MQEQVRGIVELAEGYFAQRQGFDLALFPKVDAGIGVKRQHLPADLPSTGFAPKIGTTHQY